VIFFGLLLVDAVHDYPV